MSPGWAFNMEEMPIYTLGFSSSPSMPTVRDDFPIEEVPAPKKKKAKRRQSKKVVQNDDDKRCIPWTTEAFALCKTCLFNTSQSGATSFNLNTHARDNVDKEKEVQEDEDWGDLPNIDALPATLACMAALQKWGFGVENDLNFIHDNMEKMLHVNLDHLPRPFSIVFPATTELAESSGLELKLSDHMNSTISYISNTRQQILGIYDLYTPMTSAREIWNSLEEKYTAEKEGADKFITFKFFEFAMEDNVSILYQVHEFLILVSKFKNLNIEIPEKLLVGAIITKLSSSWHNYKKKLMHTSEDFTLDQIQKHLRIKEETHIREKNLNDASGFKVNYVDSGKNNKGNNKKRKGTWNSSKNNKKDKKPLSEVVCYQCGEKGHIKRYCKNPKKKNQNSNRKDESANIVEQVDTTEITAMVSEMNIGMIQELHMASVTTTDDWWYDSGATTHVCNNRDLFKTYKETADGHEVMMGDNHTSKVIGSGNVEIQFTSGKKLTLMNVLHVPNIRKNLVSGFKLCKSRVKAVIESDKVI
ncbi:zinc finger, CCHC-type containing protein, partial [Tanacetum coccineum]